MISFKWGAIIGPLLISTTVLANEKPSVEKGKRIWLSACIQCHNKDPNIKGPIGPEVVDAPYEIMYSKVMTGRYPDKLPAGFVPKRKSKAMRKLPQYKNDIPSIFTYVQSVKKKKK